ncbi:MAG: phosphate ABC transporter permease subunit PstC [Polyangiaceae bacterium]
MRQVVRSDAGAVVTDEHRSGVDGDVEQTGLRGLRDAGIWQLLTGAHWKPEAGIYGGAPLLFGTLASALGATFFGAVPAVCGALWLSEFAGPKIRALYRRVMETAAAIPSVVYGWLALVHLVPLVGKFAHCIYGEDAAVGGEGLLSSAILLGIMIAPTVMLLSLDAIGRIPQNQRDASTALGASRWQTATQVVLSGSRRGIYVAVFFGLSRAAGETMAVQMVIGGARLLPKDLFSPTTTISSQIVMDMQNARPGTLESNALFAMALVLLMFSAGLVALTRKLGEKGSA